MILFTRAVARDFRALFARCVAGRPRGPAPPVLVEVKNGVRTIVSTTPDGVVLTHTSLAPQETEDFIVAPSAILADVEGGTDELVTLDLEAKSRGVMKWHGGVKPRSQPVELILPGKQHEVPSSPKLVPADVKLLTALHECGRTAAKESGRYALAKVQIQGKQGRVVGTDGQVALAWKGLPFSFTDDLLVPALPVFGSKPLPRISEVRIGRTSTCLVVVGLPHYELLT